MPILKNEWVQKEFWLNTKNLGLIAQALGYVPDKNFEEALRKFNEEVVSGAKITNLLFPLAQRHFSSWQPPLEKLNSQNSRGDNLFPSCQNRK